MRKSTRAKNIAMFEMAHESAEPFATVFGAGVVVPEAIEETIRHIAPDRIQIYSDEKELPTIGRRRSDHVDYCALSLLMDGTSSRQIAFATALARLSSLRDPCVLLQSLEKPASFVPKP